MCWCRHLPGGYSQHQAATWFQAWSWRDSQKSNFQATGSSQKEKAGRSQAWEKQKISWVEGCTERTKAVIGRASKSWEVGWAASQTLGHLDVAASYCKHTDCSPNWWHLDDWSSFECKSRCDSWKWWASFALSEWREWSFTRKPIWTAISPWLVEAAFQDISSHKTKCELHKSCLRYWWCKCKFGLQWSGSS